MYSFAFCFVFLIFAVYWYWVYLQNHYFVNSSEITDEINRYIYCCKRLYQNLAHLPFEGIFLFLRFRLKIINVSHIRIKSKYSLFTNYIFIRQLILIFRKQPEKTTQRWGYKKLKFENLFIYWITINFRLSIFEPCGFSIFMVIEIRTLNRKSDIRFTKSIWYYFPTKIHYSWWMKWCQSHFNCTFESNIV